MVTRLDCGDVLSKSTLLLMMSYGEFSMKGKNKLLDFYLQYKPCEISLGSVKMLLKFALAERIRACQHFFVAYFISL